VEVVDYGIGIAPSEISQIFEPFYRGNEIRNISGYGIGLSLVKKIVDMHNGVITVESTEGVGSRFTVKIPNLIGLEV
jgi:signal transduction histidine kinase